MPGDPSDVMCAEAKRGSRSSHPLCRGQRDVDAEDAERVVGFRAAYVFDVEQTEGDPLPQPAEAAGDPGDNTSRLKTAIEARGIQVEYVQELGGALGVSAGGRIQLVTRQSPACEFAVLVHEYAHELLHHTTEERQSRNTRELEAEAVAFVVSQAVGLEVADAARDYIHLYNGDTAALTESLERVRRTASVILQELEPRNEAVA